MNHETIKLHRFKMVEAKFEVFFALWVGTALAVLGAVVGTWLTGSVLNWTLIALITMIWCTFTVSLINLMLSAKQDVWKQDDVVARLRAEEAFISDHGP